MEVVRKSGLWVFLGFVFSTLLGAVITSEFDPIYMSARERALKMLVETPPEDAFDVTREIKVLSAFPEDDKKTDVTFYVCARNSLLQEAAQKLIQTNVPEKLFSRPKIKLIKPGWAARRLMSERITIVYDLDHGEREYVAPLIAGMIPAGVTTAVQVLANSGKETRWHISVFLC